MAKKVRCPQCGAKNAADARRCRVCTTIINADVPAEQLGQGLGQAALRAEVPSAGEPAVAPGPPPAEPVPAPADGIVFDVPARNAAPPPPRDAGNAGGAGETVDAGGLGDDGIVIDALPRNPEAPPPPLELDDDEPFDPDGLIIDPPR